MVDLRHLGFVLVGLFTRIYLTTAYESGSLCMYHTMTAYESFALEVAYKITKKRLGSRVFIFKNLTQVWNGGKTVEHHDQIFLLILGRPSHKDDLYQKLEEVNFQTGFELIGNEIVDGNLPFLHWASNYTTTHDIANDTSLSDTNEEFTFRENFMDKKYGTFPPKHITFSELNLKSSTNSSLQITQFANLNPHRDSTNPTERSEQILSSEMGKDNTIDEKEEILVKEEPRLIRVQKSQDNRKNFKMREQRYNAQNALKIHSRVREQQYDQQNAVEMYGRNRPRYYAQYAPEPEWYERDVSQNDEPNKLDWYENNLPKYFERRNAQESHVLEEDKPNAQDWSYKERVKQPTNAVQNSYKSGQRQDWSSEAITSQSRGLMDVIKDFISPYLSNKQTHANKAKVARGNNKKTRKTGACKGNQAHVPYKFIHDMNKVKDWRNFEQNPAHHYGFSQRTNNHNFIYGQEPRNKRRLMRSQRWRAKRNEKTAKARQTIRMRVEKMSRMGNQYNQHQMNYAKEKNQQRNLRGNVKYNNYCPHSVADTYQCEQASNNRRSINIGNNEDVGIGNYHKPDPIHSRAGNIDHFDHINKAVRHLNELSMIHNIAKKQNSPPNHNVIHDHQFDPINHANHMYKYENVEHDCPHIHKVQQKQDIGHFYSHNKAYQRQCDSRLQAVHVDQKNVYPYQPYQTQPVYNPNNLPVLHKIVNKQPYFTIHGPKIMHKQDSSGLRVNNAPKNRGPVWARKPERTTHLHHYRVSDIGRHTTLHVIDIVKYHYEPRQNMMF